MWLFRPKFNFINGQWCPSNSYEVGFFDLYTHTFISIYGCDNITDAESKVHYLNGGN